jgi:hypothetical protein
MDKTSNSIKADMFEIGGIMDQHDILKTASMNYVQDWSNTKNEIETPSNVLLTQIEKIHNNSNKEDNEEILNENLFAGKGFRSNKEEFERSFMLSNDSDSKSVSVSSIYSMNENLNGEFGYDAKRLGNRVTTRRYKGCIKKDTFNNIQSDNIIRVKSGNKSNIQRLQTPKSLKPIKSKVSIDKNIEISKQENYNNNINNSYTKMYINMKNKNNN